MIAATVDRLSRVALNVSDLSRLAQFYESALGFTIGPELRASPALCAAIGVSRMRTRHLRLGGQEVELCQCDPSGVAYPSGADAADLIFQHFAMVTHDIYGSYRRLRGFAPVEISRGGPVHLPARSGGVTAFKFRDPDGHPLELIEFTQSRSVGIDHSAIAVADVNRSIAYYENLGLRATSRQLNVGAEQDALDNLVGATVDVVAISPSTPTPHVELLAYQAPLGRPAPELAANAIAASRLVMDGADMPASAPALASDPDGHRILLLPMSGNTVVAPSR